MPITRDQASRLLTQPEMGLFGDSRNPALRALSEKALASRVHRTRKLRDKSRDLLQRQKLNSREHTGSKRGASGVANERTGKKGAILDDMLQRFESRFQEVQSAKKPAVITPELALENTRALLEAKQQRERQPPAYLAIDSHAATEQPSRGFQSRGAKSKALELHEGEMRMEPIQGSISTHDRHNQGKRDRR